MLDAKGEDAVTLKDIAHTLLTQAKAGNTMAIKEVADCLDGKVPQTFGDADGNIVQPCAALIVTDGGEVSSPPEADQHEGNGSSLRGSSGQQQVASQRVCWISKNRKK